MKKNLCLILISILLAGVFNGCTGRNNEFSANSVNDGPEAKQSLKLAKVNTQFAFELFQTINQDDTDKNVFISPLSISTALTMAYNGAETTTEEAMVKTLNYTGMEREEINQGYKYLLHSLQNVDKGIELNISNSIWIRKEQEVKQTFLEINKDVFHAHIEKLDFSKAAAADTVNRWVNRATKGKIDKIIDSNIHFDVLMYLVNAVYFKGDWTEKFDKHQTFDSKFKTEKGAVHSIKMMKRKDKIEFGKGSDYKIVRLPYGKGKIALYCILPDEVVGINDFIKDLTQEKWAAMRQSISKTNDVVLQIPRFKLEYGIKDLNLSLTTLGMGEAFEGSADFSGIGEGISIGRVLHKAVIEVNEEGSEAAAVTVVEMTKSEERIEPITFIADRPFVFVITDEASGTIVFMGKVTDIGDQETTSQSEYQTISPAKAKERLENDKDIVLLDVRTKEEYVENHISGSLLLPMDDIKQKITEKVPEKNTVIFVYCRSGRRSTIASNQLIQMGYTQVYDLGGIIDWPYGTESGE